MSVTFLDPPDLPQVSMLNGDSFVRSGDNVTLVCLVTGGNPPPEVSWYLKDRLLSARFHYDLQTQVGRWQKFGAKDVLPPRPHVWSVRLRAVCVCGPFIRGGNTGPSLRYTPPRPTCWRVNHGCCFAPHYLAVGSRKTAINSATDHLAPSTPIIQPVKPSIPSYQGKSEEWRRFCCRMAFEEKTRGTILVSHG